MFVHRKRVQHVSGVRVRQDIKSPYVIKNIINTQLWYLLTYHHKRKVSLRVSNQLKFNSLVTLHATMNNIRQIQALNKRELEAGV